MRNISKVILAAVVFVLMLSGCGGGTAIDLKSFTKDDLYFYDVSSGKNIYLGMSKDEVEKVLGKSIKSAFDYVIYKNGLILTYHDNSIVRMSLMIPKDFSYDKNGIRFNSDIFIESEKSKIEGKFGEQTLPSSGKKSDYNYLYVMELKGDSLTKLQKNPKVINGNSKIIYLRFDFADEQKVSNIDVVDANWFAEIKSENK